MSQVLEESKMKEHLGICTPKLMWQWEWKQFKWAPMFKVKTKNRKKAMIILKLFIVYVAQLSFYWEMYYLFVPNLPDKSNGPDSASVHMPVEVSLPSNGIQWMCHCVCWHLPQPQQHMPHSCRFCWEVQSSMLRVFRYANAWWLAMQGRDITHLMIEAKISCSLWECN